MLFPERPITLAHLREFCGRFNDGVRVEYKSTFDASVRAAIPKIVSSFANSQGGVCIIGINTQTGTPLSPFTGFAPPPREELALTIESICLQNINPPVLPETTVVASDTAGLVFLIIEIEESGEAPHSIENSRKVYVRTGNAANPYELAEVDLIIDLVKRRKEPLELRDRILRLADERTYLNVMRGAPSAHVSICSRFPRTPLCSTHAIWEFLNMTPYRGTGFFPQASLRRVPDGVGASVPAQPTRTSNEYGELNRYGLVMAKGQLNLISFEHSQVLPFRDLFHLLFKLLTCAERFYQAVGYRGTLLVQASMSNILNQEMPFIPNDPYNVRPASDFRCFANSVSAERITDFEGVGAGKLNLFVDILSELAWSFWQSSDDFPLARLDAYIRETVIRMGRI